jgi:cytosine/adenosine deaminase-related metal-dependent hydrolase
MPNKHIFNRYGLIGDNLDLKKNIDMEIDNKGRIIDISYSDPEKFIDLSENEQNLLMIPGFINSHVHIGDSFAKELGFNKDLIEVVAPPNGIKHKLLKQTPKDVKIKGIKKAVLEMLSSGITTFIDFRENGVEGLDLIKEALQESQMNYLALGRFTNEKDFDLVYELADGIGLVSYKHISRAMKEKLGRKKDKNNKIIACHCAENMRNEALIKDLFKDKIIDVVVHGTQFIKNDLERIKKNDMALILCPRCNGYFGVGFPPIIEILKLKIPISLGTDNVMANNLNLFEEMRYLHGISRVMDKSVELEARELLKMITINAARNFRVEENIGSIKEGKYADFFTIDLCDPNYYSHQIDNNIIYPIIVQRTRSENIKQTYIKGELAFERK